MGNMEDIPTPIPETCVLRTFSLSQIQIIFFSSYCSSVRICGEFFVKHLMNFLPQYFHKSCMGFFVQVLQNLACVQLHYTLGSEKVKETNEA